MPAGAETGSRPNAPPTAKTTDEGDESSQERRSAANSALVLSLPFSSQEHEKIARGEGREKALRLLRADARGVRLRRPVSPP